MIIPWGIMELAVDFRITLCERVTDLKYFQENVMSMLPLDNEGYND